MASFNYYILNKYFQKNGKKVLKSTEISVYLFVIHDAKHIAKLKTEIRVLPKHWDSARQMLKSQATGYVSKKELLDKLKKSVEIEYSNIREKYPEKKFDEITKNLKEFVKTGSTPIYTEQNKSFFDVYDDYLAAQSEKLQYRTVQKLKTLKNALMDFEVKHKYKLTFDKVNMEFHDKFLEYLQAKPPQGRQKNRPKGKQQGLQNATVEKYFSDVIKFMRWAYDRDKHTSMDYTKSGFKETRNKNNKANNDIITLGYDELKTFYQFKFVDERLGKVRDLFCFMAFTGQRWSDASAFRKEDLKKRNGVIWWDFTSKKTGKLTKIPLTGYMGSALTILKKYDYKLPEFTAQKFNDALKVAGKVAGMDRDTSIERGVGNKIVTFNRPLHEAMSSHMGRRTCVSLLLNKYKMSVVDVMEITQHSDYETLLKYKVYDPEELLKSIKNTANSDMEMKLLKTVG